MKSSPSNLYFCRFIFRFTNVAFFFVLVERTNSLAHSLQGREHRSCNGTFEKRGKHRSHNKGTFVTGIKSDARISSVNFMF